MLSGTKGGGGLNNWVGLLVVLLALVMNEGAVDSIQNGLAAAISGHFLKSSPLSRTRRVCLGVFGCQGCAVRAMMASSAAFAATFGLWLGAGACVVCGQHLHILAHMVRILTKGTSRVVYGSHLYMYAPCVCVFLFQHISSHQGLARGLKHWPVDHPHNQAPRFAWLGIPGSI